MADPDWYQRPLNWQDVLAGASLIGISVVTAIIYTISIRIMKRQDKVIIGYRFLVSAGFLDILMLFNYGIWPGVTIVSKSEIIPKEWRHWLQFYLDWAWFAMVWHITLVAWSRWSAIRSPYSYKYQRRLHSYAICGCFFLVSLAEVLATHFQSWYVTFYYEPSLYGMLAEDISLYLSGGQSTLFLINNLIAIIPAIIFYTLLIPCIINMAVFSVGQVAITFGTGNGKWSGFLVMLIFCTKSALNLYLLLIFSKSLRKQLLIEIGVKRRTCIQEKCSSPICEHVFKKTVEKWCQ